MEGCMVPVESGVEEGEMVSEGNEEAGMVSQDYKEGAWKGGPTSKRCGRGGDVEEGATSKR